MKRVDGRRANQLRPVTIQTDYAPQAAGSALIAMGNTRVLCAASVESVVPRWMREQQVVGGWITGEYSMLPYSTAPRKPREVTRGRLEGRTQEIQRLIGRALRAVTDLKSLGTRTIWIDCDVLQADGGTRTAAITGGYVALSLAIAKLQATGALTENPVRSHVAAISVGMFEGTPILDLCYAEDAQADVDMNVVMTDERQLVEIQGTGEECTFSPGELTRPLKLATTGIGQLVKLQKKTLG